VKSFLRSILKSIYCGLQIGLVKKLVLPFFFSKARRRESFQKNLIAAAMAAGQYPVPDRSGSGRRIWFHAASVGELECLWPVIIGAAQVHNEIILSILSESARSSLEGLKKTLAEFSATVVYAGYSPWEGEWSAALDQLRPTLFMTAKYEAWPELWVGLRDRSIPLGMVSVHARKSLKIARWLCQLFSGGLPRMFLFTCLASETDDLRNLFPEAEIEVTGEPRWDRVFQRAHIGNIRAQELIQLFSISPRPWGVIGSAWAEDLSFLGPVLKGLGGTLWVVPHRVHSESIQKIIELLMTIGISATCTSALTKSGALNPHLATNAGECILVDEIGFLSELYSVVDWAFVGGGFGVGIHSTIEPAIHGIPIGVGPKGTLKFSEVTELVTTGQLTVLRTESELLGWVNKVTASGPPEQAHWRSDAQFRLGATQKILRTIENLK
jgi:3-deoxy-D-manno-octulosonic-acid transferase